MPEFFRQRMTNTDCGLEPALSDRYNFIDRPGNFLPGPPAIKPGKPGAERRVGRKGICSSFTNFRESPMQIRRPASFCDAKHSRREEPS
jgi:hypothetical protein